MKWWFINMTGREYIIYKIVDQIIFQLLKLKFFLLKGHIFRSKKISAYIKNNKVKKLHLGCGGNKLKGFLNSDIFGDVPIDVTSKLPFKNEVFDLIYSNHLLEHIYKKQFVKYLKESYRILKKGGTQIICMPSIEKIARTVYGENEKSKNIIFESHLKRHSLDDKVFPSSYINDVMHINFAHKYLYDLEYIKYLAKKAGYKDIKKIDNFKVTDNIVSDHIKKSKNDFRNTTSETFTLYK